MRLRPFCNSFTLALVVMLGAVGAEAADYPKPQDGTWIVKDYRFHTGEILPELRLHYMTIGAPSGEPVLVLHGSAGSGQTFPAMSFHAAPLTPRAGAVAWQRVQVSPCGMPARAPASAPR